ncbi:hypothetical protein C7271_12770 [filamentous cyanobacterium CCP5]|nr:hypothetical protein C7271_12770 [filamentous cyanobacterium CCP5]
MALKRLVSSWLLIGGMVAVPGTLAGCSGMPDHHDTASHSMPAGQTDHSAMMDLGPQDEAFDLRFIDGMILHHQGAIAMAESALQNSQRDEVKQLAQEILAAQQREIDQMQQWRQAWYGE